VIAIGSDFDFRKKSNFNTYQQNIGCIIPADIIARLILFTKINLIEFSSFLYL
jgi:hypothetical protein